MIDAVKRGDNKSVEHLVRTGSDVNVRDSDGSPLLHIATSLNHVQAIKTLLSLGADAKATNQSGYTFLDIAHKLDMTEIIDLGASHFRVSRDRVYLTGIKREQYCLFIC